MLSISVIAHNELLEMLDTAADPGEILRFLPRWETVERIRYLVESYRAGRLAPLEVAELDSILELVPAIVEYRRQVVHH